MNLNLDSSIYVDLLIHINFKITSINEQGQVRENSRLYAYAYNPIA